MLGDGFDLFRSDVWLAETQDSLASLPPCGELAPSADQHGRGQSKPDRRLGFTEPAPPGDFARARAARPARRRAASSGPIAPGP